MYFRKIMDIKEKLAKIKDKRKKLQQEQEKLRKIILVLSQELDKLKIQQIRKSIK